MKSILPLVLLVVATVLRAAQPTPPTATPISQLMPEDARELQIGDPAPDFSLPGVDGKTHTLSEYKDADLLMIAFLSNHCPDSHAAQIRIQQLVQDVKGKSFALVAINPNNPDGLSIDELGYSKYNDGFEDMKKYAADSGFTFPYLYDGESQAVARAYGCLATPHIFIFDGARKLRYKGYFDDSRYADPTTVQSSDARTAVDALLAGKPVPVAVTKPHGCSTKWMIKKPAIAVKMEKWDQTPVDLEQIDVAGIAALRKNGTKKVRVFNVWATWCVPCVAEFPELVQTARKFDLREFEFISISVDELKDAPRAKAFLEKRGAGISNRLKTSLQSEGLKTTSFIFNGAKLEDLMKVLDADWPGGIPHTILVSTNGEVVWRHNGPIDGDELRGRILDYMGPYYRP